VQRGEGARTGGYLPQSRKADTYPQTTGKKKAKPRWPVARTGVKLCLLEQKLSPARCDHYAGKTENNQYGNGRRYEV
jgi:hypothetical protein